MSDFEIIEFYAINPVTSVYTGGTSGQGNGAWHGIVSGGGLVSFPLTYTDHFIKFIHINRKINSPSTCNVTFNSGFGYKTALFSPMVVCVVSNEFNISNPWVDFYGFIPPPPLFATLARIEDKSIFYESYQAENNFGIIEKVFPSIGDDVDDYMNAWRYVENNKYPYHDVDFRKDNGEVQMYGMSSLLSLEHKHYTDTDNSDGLSIATEIMDLINHSRNNTGTVEGLFTEMPEQTIPKDYRKGYTSRLAIINDLVKMCYKRDTSNRRQMYWRETFMNYRAVMEFFFLENKENVDIIETYTESDIIDISRSDTDISVRLPRQTLARVGDFVRLDFARFNLNGNFLVTEIDTSSSIDGGITDVLTLATESLTRYTL